MNRILLYLFFATLTVFPTFTTLASENSNYKRELKVFSFSQERGTFNHPFNFSIESVSKEKVKYNGKMKAGLVLGIIGSVTLNKAFSAGIATSILWSLTYIISRGPTTDQNSLGKGLALLTLLIPAIATAAYAAFNFVLGLVLTIIGFSLLSKGHDEAKKLTLEMSYENRPALAFAIKL